MTDRFALDPARPARDLGWLLLVALLVIGAGIGLRDPWPAARRITTAGSVFVGDYAPESAGDYASGTNHTLPTGGCARAYSGVNIDSFLRRITYQELSRKGLATLSPTVIAMAEAEGLGAHAAAVRVRMKGGVL